MIVLFCEFVVIFVLGAIVVLGVVVILRALVLVSLRCL